MKQNRTPKKLQLAKVKIANLNLPKEKGAVCLTSLAQTTCPHCNL